MMKRSLLAALAWGLALGGPAGAATPAVSAGNHHSVALHADGTVRTWGDDSSGQLGLGRTLLARAPAAVLGIANVIQVSSGYYHVVALRGDGTVWAWGANSLGQLGDATTTNRSTPAPVQGLVDVIEISAGNGFTLALKRDGTVWSWGENYRGQLGYEESQRVPLRVPGLPFIRHIAAGGGHGLALSDEGIVWGWGGNDMGQLGDGTTTELYTGRFVARPVVQLANVAAISAGSQWSVAATVNGLVYAWGGAADPGLLGSATVARSSVPILVVGLSGVTALSAGEDHTLALLNDRTVMAWGGGYSGQLGDGQHSPSPTPVRVLGLANVERIETGVYFSVARTSDGSVWAWGDNTYGGIGDGTTETRNVPQRVASIPAIDAISAGGYHAFGVAGDGRVYAWGANDFGELGDGVKPLRTTPAVVPGATAITQVVGGGTHTLALKGDGTVLAWGSNGIGELGDGSRTSRSLPAPVPGLAGVAEVGAGYYTSTARKSDGTLWTWGYNYQGLLGLGDQDTRESPVQVPGLTGIKSISMGSSHTLAIASDNTVRAWGVNGAGQLGDGTTIDRHSPVAVVGLAGVKAVAAGGNHSLALKNDGTVWSWGENYSGELGDGTNNRHSTPAIVPGLSGIAKIAAGSSFSFALKDDGTVLAWGANWNAQLGDGTGYSQTSPVPVARLRGIDAISGGGGGGLALNRNGTVASWGDNIDGRLGDGTFVDRDSPVAVLREDGAGSLEANDWFLDLNPAIAKTIAPDLIPVFLVVATNAAGEITANLRFRGQDVGTTSSVFAFALAPSGIVKNLTKEAVQVGFAKSRDRAKDAPPACVLAQVVNGQMQQVTASTLQAYATNVLASQGQSVSLLNSASLANAAGATFFVGYGANGGSMIDSGLNRSAVTIPGSVTCQPQAPQTGWWWNPLEGGRGFSIEMQGSNLFFAAFHYEASGRATWNVSPGRVSLDGSLFTSDLYNVTGGQTLSGAYKPAAAAKAGTITLAFTDATHGMMVWPGGTVPIERMNLVPGGLAAEKQANQPENGWWWNPAESGRGFFIEWQKGYADIAGYMYDDAGNPVWYISVYETPNPRVFSGNWWSFANGQSMGGAYRPATRTSDNVAAVTINFTGPDTAVMTLPNGRTTALTRQRF